MQVREECISFTARMDRKHRPIYRLDTVQMPTFHARHQSHGVRPGGHRHRIGFLSDHNKVVMDHNTHKFFAAVWRV